MKLGSDMSGTLTPKATSAELGPLIDQAHHDGAQQPAEPVSAVEQSEHEALRKRIFWSFEDPAGPEPAEQRRAINFATAVVEPGPYESLHINIDERRSNLVEKGVQKSLRVPSEEIKILRSFTVDTDHTTTLPLDFDAKASLVRLGNGEWLLQPLIVVTGQNQSSQP
jgi:hypothetical protein